MSLNDGNTLLTLFEFLASLIYSVFYLCFFPVNKKVAGLTPLLTVV